MRWAFRAPLILVLALFMGVVSFGGLSPASSPQAPKRDLFVGEAFGSFSFVGQTARSGKTAYVVMGCQVPPGTHLENTLGNNQNNDSNSSSGSVRTSADAIKNPSATETLTSALASGVSMLKGRITASRAKAVSETIREGNVTRVSSAGSTLSDLTVDGKPYQVQPGPNTKVNLPGLGYAVLNEQFTNDGGPLTYLVVNAIHAYVTQPNGLGIPVGSQYIMSHAISALKPNVEGVVGGEAYGHKAFDQSNIQSGPSAIVYMPCAGTGGQVIGNTMMGGQDSKPAFGVGTIQDTVQGTVGADSITSRSTSSVQSVSLFAGMVSADEVRAIADAAKTGDSTSYSDAGSQFTNLVVNGHQMGDNIKPNTQIKLPGIGTLWLHRVIQWTGGIEVRMMELEVTQANNPFNLKPGSKLQIAVARAVVLP